MRCSEKCWTAKKCPDHPYDTMYPFGRSAGEYAYYCCDNYADPDINPRHLWNEHDSTRWYTDPEGWKAHEETCEQCKEGETEGGSRVLAKVFSCLEDAQAFAESTSGAWVKRDGGRMVKQHVGPWVPVESEVE